MPTEPTRHMHQWQVDGDIASKINFTHLPSLDWPQVSWCGQKIHPCQPAWCCFHSLSHKSWGGRGDGGTPLGFSPTAQLLIEEPKSSENRSHFYDCLTFCSTWSQLGRTSESTNQLMALFPSKGSKWESWRVAKVLACIFFSQSLLSYSYAGRRWGSMQSPTSLASHFPDTKKRASSACCLRGSREWGRRGQGKWMLKHANVYLF